LISFNAVLRQGGYDLAGIRFLRHKESAALRGRSVYELWRDQRDVFEEYQTQHSAAAHQTLKSATHWASFIGTPDDETLFVGLYSARFVALSATELVSATTGVRWEPGTLFLYEMKPEAFLSEYAGRLYVEWGPGKRTWFQHASRNEKQIVEIKRQFEEEAFPGYLAFISDLSRLSLMPAGWNAALAAVRGVYVLTCPRTKELYIGSATGADGFLGRWNEYVRDGHGGNIQLKSRDGSDYQVAILEVAGTSMTTQDIKNLESHWKNKLETRKMGLNSN
jgi:hypothetical protein